MMMFSCTRTGGYFKDTPDARVSIMQYPLACVGSKTKQAVKSAQTDGPVMICWKTIVGHADLIAQMWPSRVDAVTGHAPLCQVQGLRK